MAKHTLLVDGYTVGDRLLEGVLFAVEVEETPGNLTIGAIKPSPEAEAYLANIRWENFLPALRAQVQGNIDHLLSYCAGEGRTINEELDLFERDYGEPRIQLLMEV